MVNVTLNTEIPDRLLKYAVCAAKYGDEWIFCRHRERSTWEMPGGHREPGETIIETARRELYEETGAVEFTVEPVCTVVIEENGDFYRSMLFYAEVTRLTELPCDFEMQELIFTKTLPQSLTYPTICDKEFAFINDWLNIKTSNYKITLLEKGKWKGYQLDFNYTSDAYYNLELCKIDGGWNIQLIKTPFEPSFIKTDGGYDKLYQPHWDNAEAYGILLGDELIGVIEVFTEAWNNRLNITELWVKKEYRRRGIGKALINFVTDKAKSEKRRAISLETQSCNADAIAFYLSMGFELIGFDTCDYNNDDISRHEVHLDFGYLISQ